MFIVIGIVTYHSIWHFKNYSSFSWGSLFETVLCCSTNTMDGSYFILKNAAAAKSLQSCPTLCDPIDGSPLGSSVPGVLQARILEWVAISFSSAWKWKVKSESEDPQLCLTLSDPMDCSLPGSSIHGIFQARVLEWGAIAFSILKNRSVLTLLDDLNMFSY